MGKDQSSIQSEFLNKMMLIVFVSIGFWCLIWIHSEYTSFKSESELLRTDYILSQRHILQQEVTSAVRYIHDMREQSEQRLGISLQERVNEAHQIATHIYDQNAGSKELDEIQKMIKDALRPIRFNGQRGYYFAVSMEGVEQLYPVNPEFEGKNLLGLQDSKGNFVIQDEIALIQEHQEGFVRHFWTKPGKDPSISFPKISFIKYFKPLDWYLGTGEYQDEAREQIQGDVLNRLANLRFGTEGYFFASTYGGDPLFSNGKITRGGPSIWELTDSHGVKIIQEQRRAVENSRGGFVEYVWHRLDTVVPAPKISFVMGVPEWEWIIGAGIYVDTIEKTISENRALLNTGLKKRIFRSVVILALLLGLAYFWARRTSRHIQDSVEIFSRFLQKSQTESVTLDPGAVRYREFQEIARATNTMLEQRIEAEEALRRSEEVLSQSEEKYRTMIEHSNDMIWTLDPTGNLTFYNKQAEQVTGLQQEAWIGKSFLPLIMEEDLPMVTDLFQRTLKGESIEYELRLKRPDNTLRDIAVNSAPIWKNSQVSGIVSFGRDITEQKSAKEEKIRLETQLLQAQKMEAVGTLAGGVAHDFNNILSGIFGYSQLAEMHLDQPEKARQHLAQVFKGAQRASALVQQILTYSRQTDHKKQPVRLSEVLEEALKLLRPSIPATIEIQENIVSRERIMADPTQIHQVIMNLCTNAYHAMGQNPGVLSVGLEAVEIREKDVSPHLHRVPGRYLNLEIRDSGHGMDEKTLERIFDPYFTTKALGKGTGLGLAVVDGIVKNHHGFIQISSRKGMGATFQLFFPVIEPESSENSTQEKQLPLPRGCEQIMLVDDEIDILETLQAILERQGYKVTAFQEGVSALQTFTAAPDFFDLIITDMTMPQMAGDEFSAQVLKIRKNIPIILCTGFHENFTADRARNMGICKYVQKPIMFHELSALIREILDKNS